MLNKKFKKKVFAKRYKQEVSKKINLMVKSLQIILILMNQKVSIEKDKQKITKNTNSQ